MLMLPPPPDVDVSDATPPFISSSARLFAAFSLLIAASFAALHTPRHVTLRQCGVTATRLTLPLRHADIERHCWRLRHFFSLLIRHAAADMPAPTPPVVAAASATRHADSQYTARFHITHGYATLSPPLLPTLCYACR